MDEERRKRIDDALATAQGVLDVVVNELRLEDEANGRVPGVHGVDHVGGEAGRGEDPDRRSRDASRGGGPLADRVVDGDDAEAGGGGAGVAGRSAGRSPAGLPAAASHLVEGAHFKVIDGTNDGKDGILAPGSIEVSGFGRVSAEIVTPGGVYRCRAEDLVAVDG